MTTPDDPAYENQPQHWNQPHAFTLNAVGSEISGAFSNANGISFGLSGTAVTASYTVPTLTPYFSKTNTTFNGVNISGSITNNTDGFQLSLSVGAGGAGDGVNILAAGTQTANTTGSVLFVDSHGISFGMSNNSRITASYTVPTQSNQTGGIYHGGNTTGQSSSSTYDLRTLSIDGAGIISAGWSAGSLRLSATQSNQAFSADASSTFQTLTFQNSNGVSFSNNAGALRITHDLAFSSQTNLTGRIYVTAQSTGQSSSSTYDLRTLSIIPDGIISAGWSGGSFRISATQSNQAFSADASSTFQTLSFQNSNGFTFSNNAGAIRASYSVPVVSNALQSVGSATNSGTNASRFAADDHVHAGVFSVGVSNLGNTAGDTRVDVGRFVFQGGDNITLSQITAANALNTIIVSGGAGGAGETRVSAYAVSNTTQSTSGTIPLSLLSFQGNGIVSAGISNGSVVISATQSNQAVSNSAGSFTFQTLNFSNANNVTFGTSAGGIITASVAAPGAAAENNWVHLLGANTAGGTTASGTTIGYSGINLTLSGTNGSVVNISAPATSSVAGTSGISISTNGSTISVQCVPNSYWGNGFIHGYITQAGTVQANSLVSIQPFRLQWPIVVSNVMAAASLNVATAANASSAYQDLSISGVVYTRTASTLSSLFSFSNSMTATWSSNATQTVTGVKALTATFAQTTLLPGDYWVAFHVSTANSATGGAATTALAVSVSMMMAMSVGSAGVVLKQWGGQSANSQGLGSGLGVISTGATRGTIAFSDYTMTGTRAQLAPVFFGLRNQTFQ
jgi:hypothetical protein